MEAAIRRVPAVEDADIVQLVNGPEGFTPDNEFVLGESEVAGFFVGAGFCAHGIAGAGGVGRVMAEWILDGESSFDTWKMDIRRFGPAYRIGTTPWPAPSRSTPPTTTSTTRTRSARPVARCAARRCTPGAATWAACSARRADGSAPTGSPRTRTPGTGPATTGWAGQHWSPAIEGEALRLRDTVALFDETSFSKMEVVGSGAATFSTGSAPTRSRATGSVTYTQLLNDRGGIECDLTATRLAEDRSSLVTGTAFGNHDLAWIRRHRPADGSVRARDVTAAWSCFGLWGPRARDLLQPLTRTTLANEAFPYLSAQPLSLGPVPVLAVRVTFVGELGWELYCPTDYGVALWDRLWSAGEERHGLVAGGYRAIDALRVEKGYRVWGIDITPEENPYEAGLGFCVRLDKPGGFVGRDALLGAIERGPRSQLSCLILEDPHSIALGNEPVRVGGEMRSSAG